MAYRKQSMSWRLGKLINNKSNKGCNLSHLRQISCSSWYSMIFICIGQYSVRRAMRIWHKCAGIRKEQLYQYIVLNVMLYVMYKMLHTLFCLYPFMVTLNSLNLFVIDCTDVMVIPCFILHWHTRYWQPGKFRLAITTHMPDVCIVSYIHLLIRICI